MSTRSNHRLIEAAIAEAIRRGFVEVLPSDDGVVRYQITELGVKYFEGVIDDLEEE
jgi:hypothetical protein